MQSRNRRRQVVSALALGAVLLSGCSGLTGGPPASAPASRNTSSGAPTTPSKVTIMTWFDTNQKSAVEKSFESFEKKTGIDVEITTVPSTDYFKKVSSMALSNSLPDLFVCANSNGSFAPMAANNQLFDWTAYLDDAGEAPYDLERGKFAPGYLETYTVGGKTFGIPHEVNVNGVYYNKKLFEEAGVAMPTENWTWDDLFSAAEKMTLKNGDKVQRYGLIAGLESLDSPRGISMYAQSMGGKPLAENFQTWLGVKRLTADDKFIEGARRFSEAVRNGYITGPDYASQNAAAAFVNGDVPMLYGGQWYTFFFGSDPKDPWGYVPMPAGPGGRVSVLEANGMCSPKALKDPDSTWKALSYMVETAFPEAYANLGITPIAYNPGPQQGGFFTFMENKAKTDPGYAEVMKAVITDMNNPLKSGTAFIDPWSAKAGDVQKAVWNPMLNGKKPVEEAVKEYIDKVNALANA